MAAGEISTGSRADDIGRKQQSKQLLVIYLLANDSKRGGGEGEQESQRKKTNDLPKTDLPFLIFVAFLNHLFI